MIIIEDGSIVENANSYVTLSGVNSYTESYGLDDWYDSSVTDTIREQAIFKSMRYLESLSWKGIKSTAGQNLEWPRVNVTDKNGYVVDSDIVPIAVSNAQCEIAVLMLPNSEINLQPTYTKEDFLIESSIAGATTERWNPDYVTRRPINTVIRDILKGLIHNSFSVPVERS